MTRPAATARRRRSTSCTAGPRLKTVGAGLMGISLLGAGLVAAAPPAAAVAATVNPAPASGARISATRAIPDYWRHYTEQAAASAPALDPDRSRGGIHELELAIDVMSARYNDTGALHPVNVVNTGGRAD